MSLRLVNESEFAGIKNVSMRKAIVRACEEIIRTMEDEELSDVTFTPEQGEEYGYVCFLYKGAFYVPASALDAICQRTDGLKECGVNTTVHPNSMNTQIVIKTPADAKLHLCTTITFFVDETLIREKRGSAVNANNKRSRSE